MRSASTGDPLVDKVLHYEEGSDWTAPGYYYVGPGTHTLANILNGREPVNQLDSAALAHDIDYALVENAVYIVTGKHVPQSRYWPCFPVTIPALAKSS